MQNYEVFLLTDDDEFPLGRVDDIFGYGGTSSFTALLTDLISNIAFSLEDQTTQTFKIELRSPNGL